MKTIHSNDAPAAVGPYSQAIDCGDYIFLSGQLGLDPKTGALAGADVGAQAKQACENIKAILTAAGLGFEHVVKILPLSTRYMRHISSVCRRVPAWR